MFLRRTIASFFPDAPLIDGNAGTVRQLERRLASLGLLAPQTASGGVEMMSSGGVDAIETMNRMLHMPLA